VRARRPHPPLLTQPARTKGAKPGTPPTPGAHPNLNLGRDSMASSWAGSDGSLHGGNAARAASRSDTTLGGGAGWDGGRGLNRTSSIARQPVASGEWVSRKRDWGVGKAGGVQAGWFGRGRSHGQDDSVSAGPPVPPHIILPNERGYREFKNGERDCGEKVERENPALPPPA